MCYRFHRFSIYIPDKTQFHNLQSQSPRFLEAPAVTGCPTSARHLSPLAKAPQGSPYDAGARGWATWTIAH